MDREDREVQSGALERYVEERRNMIRRATAYTLSLPLKLLSLPLKLMPKRRVVAGGEEVLTKRLRKFADENKSETEHVKFALVARQQAMIALDDRILVLKPRPFSGGRAASFYYRDITGIEVESYTITGTIRLDVPGRRNYLGARARRRNALAALNCLYIEKKYLKDYKPHLDRLREMIGEAKR